MTDSALNTAITNLADGTPNTAAEFRAILIELVNRSYKTGDVMMLSCSNAYIVANFDGTGLGIAERVGWAICNGENNTRNYNGRVPLAYGTDYMTMGGIGGSKDAVVVEHSHGFGFATQNITSGSSGNNVQGTGQTAVGGNYAGTTTTTGVSGTDKNMQPYMVTLFIQKING